MDEIETTDDGAEEIIEEIEDTTEAEVTPEPEAPKADKPKETPEQTKARLERQLKQLNKKLGVDEPTKPTAPKTQKTGELDENALTILDLKGVTEAEDIELIEKIIQKTGQTVREALKDDYVVSKLEANKKAREVKDATPSSTKRATGTTGSLEAALAKFERTQELPEDFTLRSQVVDALINKSGSNKPPWHK